MENGDLMAFFKLDGRTHDCASDRELVTWHKDLNTLVKSFGTDHVELWTHEYHHEAKEYPDGEYDHFFPAYVDQYNRKLHGDSKQLINDLYLTVIYKQVGIKHRSFWRNLKSRLVTKFSECRMRRLKVWKIFLNKSWKQ
jgi:type IV secretion system protein VirB4